MSRWPTHPLDACTLCRRTKQSMRAANHHSSRTIIDYITTTHDEGNHRQRSCGVCHLEFTQTGDNREGRWTSVCTGCLIGLIAGDKKKGRMR